MPITKKGNRRKKIQNLGDVTIYEYADTSNSVHMRVKKSLESVTSRNLINLIDEQDKQDVLVDDEYQLQNNKTLMNGINDEQKTVNGSGQGVQERNKGIDYPLDFWILISEFISPENVGLFASICKKCYYVTRMATFWNCLYNRYCNIYSYRKEKLPIYGIRANVIRKLHQRYFPVIRRNKLYFHQTDPYSLVKRQCILMWNMENEDRWYYFFKLKELDDDVHIPNVLVNPEDGCKILKVTCVKYSKIPLVIGLILQSVSINLSPGFKHQRVTLEFNRTAHSQKTMSNAIVLSDVLNVQVLNWWQPSYPFQPIQQHPVSLPPTIESWDQI